MSEVDKRTATQRIEDLEKTVVMLYQVMSQVKPSVDHLLQQQSEMVLVKDALRLLNKKTEAIVQAATTAAGITVDNVSALVVQLNVQDLTAQVEAYLKNGHIVVAEEVAENSYLVCAELDSAGTVVNPRIQFRMDSQDSTTVESLKGKKAGDVVSFGEDRFSAKILEVYTLVEPKDAEKEPAHSETETPEQEANRLEADKLLTPALTVVPASDPQALPAESPVVEFVASSPDNMITSNS